MMLHVSVVCSFPSQGYSTFCWFTHLLMDLWIVSTLELLCIKLLQTFIYQSLLWTCVENIYFNKVIHVVDPEVKYSIVNLIKLIIKDKSFL